MKISNSTTSGNTPREIWPKEIVNGIRTKKIIFSYFAAFDFIRAMEQKQIADSLEVNFTSHENPFVDIFAA